MSASAFLPELRGEPSPWRPLDRRQPDCSAPAAPPRAEAARHAIAAPVGRSPKGKDSGGDRRTRPGKRCRPKPRGLGKTRRCRCLPDSCSLDEIACRGDRSYPPFHDVASHSGGDRRTRPGKRCRPKPRGLGKTRRCWCLPDSCSLDEIACRGDCSYPPFHDVASHS